MLRILDSVLQASIVSGLLQTITDSLARLAATETSVIFGVDGEVRKLQRTLERIRAMVGHVEESRICNAAWKVWLEDVEKLIYSADDLLDGISLDLAKYTALLSADAHSDSQVRKMLVSDFKFTIPREICKVRQELDEIAKEMDVLFTTELTKLGCNNIKSCYSNSYSCDRSSVVNEDFVVGREKERYEIVEMLLNKDLKGNNVTVIPIVGMGGIGKTTLAQVVHSDDKVVETFDLRSWASVSMDFDVIRITKLLIESLTGESCNLSGLDSLQVKFRDLIKGKRFLIVLDDYWSEEYGNWDVLSSPFKFGSRGSKVIVTTRSNSVSRVVGSVPSYFLNFLEEEDCWKLIKQRAFFNSSSLEENFHVEKIGRMIAKKCKGLPLAAKTIGSMLHFKDDITEWNSVLESEIWDLPKDKNDMLPALSLSYHHLPTHLKECFAYCSIFPQDYDFVMDELVLLWMAEGFIRIVGKRRVEDLGADYFKDLVSRSFFQPSHENLRGQSIYKMHDLIHSLARSVSANTCLCLGNKLPIEDWELICKARRLSLHFDCVQSLLSKSLPWYRNLRTFRVMSGNLGKLDVPYDLFVKMESSRVLDLSCLGLDELPDSIDHLKHLRYLNLSGNPIRKLPDSVTNLFGLQTLKLEQCRELRLLPKGMKNLVSLRHLHLNVKQLKQMPPEFGRLVNLQSLPTFIVGRNKGCGIGELKNMKFLRGSICIKNLENVSNVNEAKEAMLDRKPYLEKLELEWKFPNDAGTGDGDAAVLDGLCPHENLEELFIKNYNGILFPDWLSSSFCKISSIRLRNCKNNSIVANLGKLQHLKSLHIEDMPDWFQIEREFSGFPSLLILIIEDMPRLTRWTEIDSSSLPSLHTLSLKACQALRNLPSLIKLSSLEFLTINRCPEIQSLPDDGLPVSLQALVIAESDIIKDRCRTVEGEDWDKIRSILMVEIDCVEIHRDPIF